MFWRRKQPPAPPAQPPLTADQLVKTNNELIERVGVIDTLTLLDDESKEAMRERARNDLRAEAFRYLTHEV